MSTIQISSASASDPKVVLSFVKGLAEQVGQSDLVIATVDEIECAFFSEDSPAQAKVAYYGSAPAGCVLYYKCNSTLLKV